MYYMKIAGLLIFGIAILVAKAEIQCFIEEIPFQLGKRILLQNNIDSYEALYNESMKQMESNEKFNKLCRSNEIPQFCDIIFYNKEDGSHEDIHNMLSHAKEGVSLHMDLNLAYELSRTNSVKLIPLLNKLISKLVSLYPNSLALISKSFSHSSLYLTSKLINFLNYFRNNNATIYDNWIQEEDKKVQIDTIIQKSLKFILDNVFSAQSREELFQISRIALDYNEKTTFVDWGLENMQMRINGTNLKEEFRISIKNGLCQTLSLEKVKLIYNDTIFNIVKKNSEFIIKLNLPAYGSYNFSIKSKKYKINETKTINAYSNILINSIKVSVFNEQNNGEMINYNYSKSSKNILNISLNPGDIATFLPEIYSSNLEIFSYNSCFLYLLLYNQLSGSEFIIIKRPNENQLILNYTNIVNSLINDKTYVSTIFVDCEFIYPKAFLEFGHINVTGNLNEKYENNYNEYSVQKEILIHTFQPPMKVPSNIISFAFSTIPFFFLVLYLINISNLNLKDLKIKTNTFLLLKILSITSIIIICIFLIIYWIKLNIFQGLYIFCLTLGIAFPINFQFLQIIPLNFEGELKRSNNLNIEKPSKKNKVTKNEIEQTPFGTIENISKAAQKDQIVSYYRNNENEEVKKDKPKDLVKNLEGKEIDDIVNSSIKISVNPKDIIKNLGINISLKSNESQKEENLFLKQSVSPPSGYDKEDKNIDLNHP